MIFPRDHRDYERGEGVVRFEHQKRRARWDFPGVTLTRRTSGGCSRQQDEWGRDIPKHQSETHTQQQPALNCRWLLCSRCRFRCSAATRVGWIHSPEAHSTYSAEWENVFRKKKFSAEKGNYSMAWKRLRSYKGLVVFRVCIQIGSQSWR